MRVHQKKLLFLFVQILPVLGATRMGSKDYFDHVADQWDRMRTSFFSEVVRERAFEVAGVQPRQLASDIGAGTGFITEGLLQKGLRVIAVDQSEEMLTVMRKKFGEEAEVVYHKSGAENLPIKDSTVDYVFANMLLHHLKIPQEGIQEMKRILKPGGKLVITDMDEHTFTFLREEQHDEWMGFKREDIKRWFKEAALKEVVIDSVGESCSSQSLSGDEEARISIFVAKGEK